MSPFRETKVGRAGDYVVIGGRLHLPGKPEPMHLSPVASCDVASLAPRLDSAMITVASALAVLTASLAALMTCTWRAALLDAKLEAIIAVNTIFGAICVMSLFAVAEAVFDRYVRRHGFSLRLRANDGRLVAQLRFGSSEEAERVGYLVRRSKG